MGWLKKAAKGVGKLAKKALKSKLVNAALEATPVGKALSVAKSIGADVRANRLAKKQDREKRAALLKQAEAMTRPTGYYQTPTSEGSATNSSERRSAPSTRARRSKSGAKASRSKSPRSKPRTSKKAPPSGGGGGSKSKRKGNAKNLDANNSALMKKAGEVWRAAKGGQLAPPYAKGGWKAYVKDVLRKKEAFSPSDY